MRRREFIGLIGGGAAWPMAAWGQQSRPVVGFLHPGSLADAAQYVAAFLRGLEETGNVEGQTVTIEYHWGEGQYERLPALAKDFVDRHVAVIAAGGPRSAIAAKSATSVIPIVFVGGDIANAETLALVGRLNRPTGNLTGTTVFVTAAMWGKRLELIHELLPKATSVAMLVNPNEREEPNINEMVSVANTLGIQISFVPAEKDFEIEAGFKTAVQNHTQAVLVSDKPNFTIRHNYIATLAARHELPTVYAWREYVEAGGLISYGSSLTDAWRTVGVYVGRILKGEKPAELPVQQPSKFELVINLKAARALGLTVPPSILARADEVIE